METVLYCCLKENNCTEPIGCHSAFLQSFAIPTARTHTHCNVEYNRLIELIPIIFIVSIAMCNEDLACIKMVLLRSKFVNRSRKLKNKDANQFVKNQAWKYLKNAKFSFKTCCWNGFVERKIYYIFDVSSVLDLIALNIKTISTWMIQKCVLP